MNPERSQSNACISEIFHAIFHRRVSTVATVPYVASSISHSSWGCAGGKASREYYKAKTHGGVGGPSPQRPALAYERHFDNPDDRLCSSPVRWHAVSAVDGEIE